MEPQAFHKLLSSKWGRASAPVQRSATASFARSARHLTLADAGELPTRGEPGTASREHPRSHTALSPRFGRD